jgi:hypothetical protein
MKHFAPFIYGFRVEVLHDANRIVMSVGSDCVRDPRDHRR